MRKIDFENIDLYELITQFSTIGTCSAMTTTFKNTCEDTGIGMLDGLGILSIFLSFATVAESSCGGGGGIEIWQDSFGDWHIGNKDKKENIDKTAENLYNKITGKQNQNCELIVKDKQSAEVIRELLETKNRQELINKLTALEEILLEETNQNNKNIKIKK